MELLLAVGVILVMNILTGYVSGCELVDIWLLISVSLLYYVLYWLEREGDIASKYP